MFGTPDSERKVVGLWCMRLMVLLRQGRSVPYPGEMMSCMACRILW